MFNFFKENKTIGSHPVLQDDNCTSSQPNYYLYTSDNKKIIVWFNDDNLYCNHELASKYKLLENKKKFFIAQPIYATRLELVTRQVNLPEKTDALADSVVADNVVSMETNLGKYEIYNLPNLVEALHIVDELVIKNTSVDCNHSLKNVHVIFRDIDDSICTLEIDQTLANYGVDDYRIYKRGIHSVDLAKNSFFLLTCRTYNNEHDWKENRYGYITKIHPWMY
jgi:hypothetical protein